MNKKFDENYKNQRIEQFLFKIKQNREELKQSIQGKIKNNDYIYEKFLPEINLIRDIFISLIDKFKLNLKMLFNHEELSFHTAS